jgi:hypothetical protein
MKKQTQQSKTETIVGLRLVADIGDPISGNDVMDSSPIFYLTNEPQKLKDAFNEAIQFEKANNDEYNDETIFDRFSENLEKENIIAKEISIDLEEIIF